MKEELGGNSETLSTFGCDLKPRKMVLLKQKKKMSCFKYANFLSELSIALAQIHCSLIAISTSPFGFFLTVL